MGGHLNANHLLFLGHGALWTIGLSLIALIGGGIVGFVIALARISPVPLNGDESLGNVATIIAMARAGSIQGANLKTIKLGGVGATVHAT